MTTSPSTAELTAAVRTLRAYCANNDHTPYGQQAGEVLDQWHAYATREAARMGSGNGFVAGYVLSGIMIALSNDATRA